MRDHHMIRARARQLFWNRETYRQLQVGLAAWVACGLAVSWLFGAQHTGILPSWPSLALAVGFGLGAVAIVTYGGLRFLLAPRRLTALLGAGTLFALPVLVGLGLPAVLGWSEVGLDAGAEPVLGAGLLALLVTCFLFAFSHTPHRSEPRPRDLALQLVLMVLALSLVAWQFQAAPDSNPGFEDDVAKIQVSALQTP
jgi:FtsH-binding integral membrane protein